MKTTKRLLSILLMLTMLVSMFTVMASAVATDETPATEEHKCDLKATSLEYVAAKPATCKTPGLKEHYVCPESTCRKQYVKVATGFQEVKTTDLIISADPNAHQLEQVAAKAATCTESGNPEYYHCAVCGKDFTDESGKNEIKETDKIIPATGHTLTPVAAKAATCTESGNPEYYHCAACNKDFANATDTAPNAKPMAATDKTIEPLGHKLGDLVPAVEKDCLHAGNLAYKKCLTCGKYFVEENGKWVEKAETEVIGSEVGPHVLRYVQAKPATTESEGVKAHYDCNTCGKHFADKDAKNELTDAEIVDPKLTPSEPEIKEHELSFNIGANVKLEKTDSGITIDETRTYQLKKNDAAALKFTATSLKKGYKVAWKIDNGKTYYTSTITIAYDDLNERSTLKVWVEKTSTDDLDLTIKVSGFSNGDIEYKYNGGKVTDLETREKTWPLDDKDEYVKFWLYPKTGYKAVVQLNDGKKYTYSYNESLTIDYEDLDGEDGTLYVSFVKKGSSEADDYPTLTFDITGTKHGTVYRGTREYENGDVISIKKNDKMTFKAKADKGYVAVWTYKGDTYVGDEYTVKMGSADAKLYVEFMDKDDIRLTELPFRDVSKRDWYYDDVVYVYRKGYMDGMSSTRFGGELNTTRGQIVTILWRLTGEPRATKRNPFNDVSSSQYYYDAISWAYDAGVVDGFDAHTFKPDQNVTREQLAAILYRYAEYMNLSTSGSAYLAKYKDADKIASWAYDAMAWANYHGLINGTSATRIDPKGYATRAQIAAILHRFAVEFG